MFLKVLKDKIKHNFKKILPYATQMLNRTSEKSHTNMEYRGKYNRSLSVLIFMFLLPFSVTGQTFEHPGGMYSSSLIEETRQKISEGKEPWATAYKQLMQQAEASLLRKPEAMAGIYKNKDYEEWMKNSRPVMLYGHHYAWPVPTLLRTEPIASDQ